MSRARADKVPDEPGSAREKSAGNSGAGTDSRPADLGCVVRCETCRFEEPCRSNVVSIRAYMFVLSRFSHGIRTQQFSREKKRKEKKKKKEKRKKRKRKKERKEKNYIACVRHF